MQYEHEGMSNPDIVARALELANELVDRDATYVSNTIHLTFETHGHAIRRIAELRSCLKAALALL